MLLVRATQERIIIIISLVQIRPKASVSDINGYSAKTKSGSIDHLYTET